jgi:hypothetical protein
VSPSSALQPFGILETTTRNVTWTRPTLGDEYEMSPQEPIQAMEAQVDRGLMRPIIAVEASFLLERRIT